MHLGNLVYGLLLAVPASARLGHVYLSETGRTPPASTPLSPSTARLVLAQRLGLSDFHSLRDADDSVVDAINTYGGSSARLLGAEQPSHRSRAIVLLEGIEDHLHAEEKLSRHSFSIQDPPSTSANKQLFYDFKRQNRASASSHPTHTSSHTRWHLDSLKKELGHVAACDNFTEKGLTAFLCSGMATPTESNIKDTLDSLFSWSTRHDVDLLAILMPPAPTSTLFKRHNPSSWGAYNLPRQDPDFHLDTIADDRNRPASFDIETDGPFAAIAEKIGLTHSAHPDAAQDTQTKPDDAQRPSRPSASPKPPKGILPACYASQRDCDATTHSCSGHGACKLKYTVPTANDASYDCYACACTPDVRTLDDGRTSTTRWSGPACQKVDVSVEFWLLGGFSVVLVSVVAWAVGLLYSMGNQDLPSVIGAGVAGPRAK